MGFKDRFSAASINDSVAKSFVGTWFRLEGSGHPLERPGSKFLTEIRAGTVTAAAMLYVSSTSTYFQIGADEADH
jgi:AGZA family xanthine/uracil permease-like MFS transporter